MSLSDSFNGDTDFRNTSTGVVFPKILTEPQSLSSKKDREKRSMRYIPPAPRPHCVRSAPSQTRLIHSRNESLDLDNSFHYLMNNSGTSNGGSNVFRQFFEIQERLGFGSFGDVYRVKSKADGKEYAVKKSRRTYAGESDRSRQLKEVQRVVNIPSNIHLVSLERAWEEDGYLYLQMELLSNSLTQHIEDGHYLTEEKSWDLLIDMLHALQHLHTHRLVHMDVKPDNIFLTIDSPTVYKLGDFGIVVCLAEKKDVIEYTEGDSRYLAPEVMQGTVSTKADVFSLGLTLLEVVCSVDLPKCGELWHILRNGMLPEPCPREIPRSLNDVIKWMLTPDVSLRPEVNDVLSHRAVVARIRTRQRRLRMASVIKTFAAVSRFWHAFLRFLTLLFFTISKKVSDVINPPQPISMDVDPNYDHNRITPEPFPVEPPSIFVNDNSFSDDDEMRGSRTPPVFASTPIPLSKSRSGGRLRSSRPRPPVGEGDLRAMGSPTSRNLLKEFEAVSE